MSAFSAARQKRGRKMAPALLAAGWVVDVSTIAASALAAWFWYRASDNQIHRVHAREVFDYHDLNRVIVAINRNAVRNRRAALASAIAAGLLGLDIAISALLV
jgi:hypothetical protein